MYLLAIMAIGVLAAAGAGVGSDLVLYGVLAFGAFVIVAGAVGWITERRTRP